MLDTGLVHVLHMAACQEYSAHVHVQLRDSGCSAVVKPATQVSQEEAELCDLRIHTGPPPANLSPRPGAPDGHHFAEHVQQLEALGQQQQQITHSAEASPGPSQPAASVVPLLENALPKSRLASDVLVDVKPKPADLQRNSLHQQTQETLPQLPNAAPVIDPKVQAPGRRTEQ